MDGHDEHYGVCGDAKEAGIPLALEQLDMGRARGSHPSTSGVRPEDSPLSLNELILSFHTQADPYLAYYAPMSGRSKCKFCGMPHMSYRMVGGEASVCDFGMESLKFTTERELRFDAR